MMIRASHLLAMLALLLLWLPAGVLLVECLGHPPADDSAVAVVVVRGPNLSSQPDPLAGSLWLTAAAVLITLALGLPVGIALGRLRVAGARTASILLLVPLVVPSYVVARSWQQMQVPAADGLFAAAWALASCLWPIVALFTAAGVARRDPAGEDAALLAGGRMAVWRVVVWPRAWSSIAAGAVLVALFALRDFGVAALFRVNTVALAVSSAFESRADAGRFAAAMWHALPLLAAGLVLVSALLALERHGGLSSQPRLDWPARRDAARHHVAGSIVVWLMLAISPGVPLCQLLRDANASGNLPSRFLATILQPYAAASILHTIEVSALAALLAVVLVALPVWWLARARTVRRPARWLLASAVLPLALPGALIGIGMLRLVVPREAPAVLIDIALVALPLLVALVARAARCSRGITLAAAAIPLGILLAVRSELVTPMRDLIEGPLIVSLVHVLLFAPFVVRLVAPATVAIPPAWRDSAALLTTPARAALLLDLRLLWPSLLTAAALVFLFSAGEVAATALVAPPGTVLMAPRIYNLVHYGRGDQVALYCLAFTVITLLPLALVASITGRHLRGL